MNRKVVLISKSGYDSKHEGLLQGLIDKRIELFCAVGKDCEMWEAIMDELVVGPKGEYRWHIDTTSHPSESVKEVVEFAANYSLSGESGVDIIEV